MYDCNKEIVDFYNSCVALNKATQDEMRGRRNANRNRLNKRLEKKGKALPSEFVSQGSYAMHTMVNDKDSDYDIDDGAIFEMGNLVGLQGAAMSALEVRKMVRDALDDGSFERPPEVRKNCVRVNYQAGYHVDVPIYRRNRDGSLELASSDWKGSSPTEVTAWYNEAVIEKSPDETNGRQMRRVTRLQKFFMRSRDSWKSIMPSGFELSVLVDECYVPDVNRDDFSLYETMLNIKFRLDNNLEIKHPTRNEMLTDDVNDANTRFFREKLDEAIENLQILFKPNCSRLDALKAWNSVFRHEYWKNLIAAELDDNKQEKASLLRNGNTGLALAAGLVAAGTAAAVAAKNTRAYGGAK